MGTICRTQRNSKKLLSVLVFVSVIAHQQLVFISTHTSGALFGFTGRLLRMRFSAILLGIGEHIDVFLWGTLSVDPTHV